MLWTLQLPGAQGVCAGLSCSLGQAGRSSGVGLQFTWLPVYMVVSPCDPYARAFMSPCTNRCFLNSEERWENGALACVLGVQAWRWGPGCWSAPEQLTPGSRNEGQEGTTEQEETLIERSWRTPG